MGLPLDAKIFVAGHRGMVGSAMVRALKQRGYRNIVTHPRSELDLTRQEAVNAFFAKERPDAVFMAAAKVGGIHANNTYPAEFIQDNLEIQGNIIDSAYRHGVSKLLFLGSSCIYPRESPQPIRESYLLTGPLEPTNRAYAIAKIAGIEMCWSYNRQYGTRYLAAMPSNLYGIGDTYHPENAHVIPALVRRAHELKVRGAREMVVWGTGKPRREFVYVDDMAEGCIFLMSLPDEEIDRMLPVSIAPMVNIGLGYDMTIAEMARDVCDVVGFEGPIVFDASRPDGTPRKLLDVELLASRGWRARTSLREGLEYSYQDFVARFT
jgi:GDP-L-fucose synthase